MDTQRIGQEMDAIVTLGNGGYDQLCYQKVPIPKLGRGEVLVKVLAAGVNNTEINTRLGWYSETTETGTAGAWSAQETESSQKDDGGWNLPTPFPFIQGTDCCGNVVKVNDHDHEALVGRRVLIRPCMRSAGFESLENIWMASDFDGAFAQYVKVPAEEVFPVECDWSSVELGAVPCTYGTSENMIHRAGLEQGQKVLITGASGGIGTASIQLAKRRGATVIAVSGQNKAHHVKALGADQVIHRGDSILNTIGKNAVDVVIDNVGGEDFPDLIEVLKRGGRYASSGAIAGPMVKFDLRSFYLKDLTLIGCTAWDAEVFPNIIGYIERGEIKPVIAKTYELRDIALAQIEFQKKNHVGKFVLIPPS